MRLTPRNRYVVEPEVQKSLLARTLGYWCASVLVVGLTLAIWEAVSGPPRPFLDFFYFDWLFEQYGLVLLAATVMLPIVMLDVLFTSNRVAGPIFRMRRSLRALAAGEYVQPIKFRDGDFWHELADEFNALAAYVEKLKAEAARANPRQAETVEMQPATKS